MMATTDTNKHSRGTLDRRNEWIGRETFVGYQIDIPLSYPFCRHALYAYATEAVRMSESPASMMAMVEQRKSLPAAVPSSICMTITR